MTRFPLRIGRPGGPRPSFLSFHLGTFPLLVLLCLAGWLPLRAQETGTVSGLVIESWEGKPLGGVTVTVRGTTLATQTDPQGRYELRAVPPGEQVLRFSRSGYASAVVSEVRVLPGQTTKVDGNLRPEFYEMEEFEITAEVFQEQTVAILEDRQSAAALTDAIGAAQFAKTGASDAADIMTRVTGTTIVDGKFAVIRGLGDRYNTTMLNGAEVPTADPKRKAAQLDLVPAGMIDSMLVSKTFTPDLPGGFAGGAANIVTKSFPEKFVFNFGFGLEYNTQSTFNGDYLTFEGSGTDWAGMDDGTRDVPVELENATAANLTPPLNARRGETPEVAAQRQAQADLVAAELQSFNSYQFGPTKMTPPPNHSGGFALGDTVELGGRPFGYYLAGNYSRKYSFYDDGFQARYHPSEPDPYQAYVDARSVTEVNWAAIVNLAYQLSDEHRLGFNFIHNQNSEDNARRLVGRKENVDDLVDRNLLHFIERHLQNYQMSGHHEFPWLRALEADWLISLADTSQDEPDIRYFNYAHLPGGGQNDIGNNALPQPNRPTRSYRSIEENNLINRVDFKLPFEQWEEREAGVKFGSWFSSANRSYAARSFAFDITPNDNSGWKAEGDPNNYFTLPDLAYRTQVSRNGTNYLFNRAFFTQDFSRLSYEGDSSIIAGYAMIDLPLTSWVKVVGGVRPETTDLGTTLATNRIEELDILPSVGAIFAIRTNMNIRLAWSSTIARPTFREISPIREFDPVELEYVQGNPDLRRSTIDNYDLRWEWFPRPGEVISVSGFYKDITDAIEKEIINYDGDIVTFANRPSATLYGAEFEFRRQLDFWAPLANFNAGFNFSYILSEVPLTETEALADPTAPNPRPLYDQSEWIFNVDLTWEQKTWGTAITFAANQAGPRIYAVDPGGPDIFEHPPLTLDVIVSQKLGRHWKLKFSAKNLLNPDIRRTYGDDFDTRVYSNYTRGITFGLSASCEF